MLTVILKCVSFPSLCSVIDEKILPRMRNQSNANFAQIAFSCPRSRSPAITLISWLLLEFFRLLFGRCNFFKHGFRRSIEKVSEVLTSDVFILALEL